MSAPQSEFRLHPLANPLPPLSTQLASRPSSTRSCRPSLTTGNKPIRPISYARCREMPSRCATSFIVRRRNCGTRHGTGAHLSVPAPQHPRLAAVWRKPQAAHVRHRPPAAWPVPPFPARIAPPCKPVHNSCKNLYLSHSPKVTAKSSPCATSLSSRPALQWH